LEQLVWKKYTKKCRGTIFRISGADIDPLKHFLYTLKKGGKQENAGGTIVCGDRGNGNLL